MTLADRHRTQGAALAADGIPLHYGDLHAEYHAALENAVVMERSHEGRLELAGRDRLSLPHRLSTNDLVGLRPGQGAATLFTNANARILDRALVFERGQTALALTEPGRGAALAAYLQRNIFFGDELRITDLTTQTRQFNLHGPQADAVIDQLAPELTQLPPLHGGDLAIDGIRVFAARSKPLSGQHWVLVAAEAEAEALWSRILEGGAGVGLRPSGSLLYNVLRIRAGRPGVQRELSQDYIPLEVGLWDEISFHKGCYTGQEIIARMESRSRLARVMVRLSLETDCPAPADVLIDGRAVGTLTSSVTSPDDEHFGIAVIKTAAAAPDTIVRVGPEAVAGRILALAATPPPMAETADTGG